MRKIVALVLCAVMLLSLCACGKSKKVQNVDDLILAIGEVSLDSADKIETAETAYAELSEKDKETVENYSILLDARKTYDIKKEEARQEAVQKILESINDTILDAEMERAEEMCYDLLKNEALCLTDEEKEDVDKNLYVISQMCFAGSYIVMPDYISNVPYIKVSGDDSIEELLDGKSMYVSYVFETETELLTAYKRYKEYLDSKFERIDSSYGKTGEVEGHLYVDSSNRQLYLEMFNCDSFYVEPYCMSIEMASSFFDASKINDSDSSLTIRDVDKVLK